MGSTWYRTIMAIANEILILKNNSIIKYTVTVFMVRPLSDLNIIINTCPKSKKIRKNGGEKCLSRND